MKYMGSKARFANEILPIILKDRKQGQSYVEPFCGGLGTADKVKGSVICSDYNKYLIAMWDGLKQGNTYPTDIPKDFYSDVRIDYNSNGTKYTDFIKGWVGFMGSANGRFFDGGYSGTSNTKIGTVRDYISESVRNIEKQIPLIGHIQFVHSSYDRLEIPPNSIIYCDIPYQNTKQYSFSKSFSYTKFWEWCRTKSFEGHKVFVSEYSAPNDFSCVWEKEAKSSLRSNSVIQGNKTSIERLFTFQP